MVWHSKSGRPPYVMLVPLQEVVAEALGMTIHSQKVQGEYENLVNEFGTEFDVLLKTEIKKIELKSGERIAEGIEKNRKGDLVIKPGYDGVFGEVAIWEKEKDSGVEKGLKKEKQMSLF